MELTHEDKLERFVNDFMACYETKQIVKDHTSYGWKHAAEKYIGEYISNEELQQMCVKAGLKHTGGVNWYFNISKQAWKDWEITEKLLAKKK
jgi:hypothetical protein